LDEKNQEFFNNTPFLVNFENFRVKFKFKFCGRPTVIFCFDTPWENSCSLDNITCSCISITPTQITRHGRVPHRAKHINLRPTCSPTGTHHRSIQLLSKITHHEDISIMSKNRLELIKRKPICSIPLSSIYQMHSPPFIVAALSNAQIIEGRLGWIAIIISHYERERNKAHKTNSSRQERRPKDDDDARPL
jgi:hypothetical protein